MEFIRTKVQKILVLEKKMPPGGGGGGSSIKTHNYRQLNLHFYWQCVDNIQWSNKEVIMKTNLYKIYKSTHECTYSSKYNMDTNKKLGAKSSENYQSFALSWVLICFLKKLAPWQNRPQIWQRKLLLLVLWFINMWYLWPLADLKYLPQTWHTRQTLSLSTAWRCCTKSISQSKLSLQCLQKKELAILAEIGMPIGTTGASWVTTTKEPWKPTNRKTSVNT